jgi:phosphoribosyl-ATP pyrophosphohydrolase/phosphoribosyl-AMP cyclohydrolase
MTQQVNFAKMNGLIPVAIQDADSGSVLMIGFMNEQAVQRTVDEQQVVFWSRTKQRLWKKGETSGNFLDVVSIQRDCDSDSLLIKVRPRGPVCHTGEETCFGKDRINDLGTVLGRLWAIIKDRKLKKPEGSYTTRLLNDGIARIGQKVGEEAVELAIAAQYDDRERSIAESADLLYHLLVLLEAKEIDAREVALELERRMGS